MATTLPPNTPKADIWKHVDYANKKLRKAEAAWVANTVVGFGDASINHLSKGHQPGTHKSLRRGLLRFLRRCGGEFVPIDEYNTSKKCCVCHSTLDATGLPWAVRRCTGDQCRVGRHHHPQTEEQAPDAKRSHRCLWNRDANAAANMLALTRRRLRGETTRPEALAHPKKTTAHGKGPWDSPI